MKKVISALLMILLLLSFSACSKNGENGGDAGGGNKPGADDISETEAENQINYESLPAIDYKGADFVIANIEGWRWIDVTLDVEAEESGEMLSDAIYRRNRAIEDKYNINLKIIPIPGDDMGNKVKTQMLAGACEIDIMQAPTRVVAQITPDNFIADANKLGNMDLANPWWDDFALASMSICKKQFFLYGDFTIADKEYVTAIFLNREMQKQYGLPDYYQIVREGTWTIDKMLESMRVATVDLDGDGRLTKADQFGHVTNVYSMMQVFYGAGETIIRKDKDDIPYFSVDSESYINAFYRMCEFMNTDNTTFDAMSNGSHQDDMFAEGKGLFDSTLLAAMRAPQGAQKNMDYDFGILPPPKLNEQQENYYSYCDGSTPCIAILNHDAERTERSAAVLEALNAKSSEMVQPKYMEYALPLKYFRDEESFEMLDILLKNRIFDIAVSYGWGNFVAGNTGMLRDLLVRNQPDKLASTIEQNLEKGIEAMNRDLDKMANLGQ
ncbi:MAG: extracellular solute-binding protein [Oscillospiraceae bacterium]|nr:extracellular solute-binding protein [Oscillospiraceae bacterium]